MAEKKQPAATTPLPNTPPKLTADKRTYDFNKYGVSATTYPIDLFTNTREYGDNYVVFYINVPEKSSVIQEGGSSYGKTTERDTAEIGSTIAANNNKLGREGSATIIGGALGAGVGSLAGGTKGGIIGAGLGAAGGYALSSKLSGRQNKRLTDSITLNIPNNLTARYSVNWDAEDMVLGAAAGDIANAVSNKNSSQSTMETGAAILMNLGLSKTPGGTMAQAMAGVAPNPKKEQLFKNVDFRTFNFEYQFAARSEAESRNIKQIIKMFKLHMHPEFNDKAGYLFIYPSEFEIVYYKGDSENLELPRHTSCVLVDMSVNYTPQGMYNTFDNGASTLITINLTFKELAILTKSEIEIGF